MDKRKMPRVGPEGNSTAHEDVRPLLDAIDAIRSRRIFALQQAVAVAKGRHEAQRIEALLHSYRVDYINENWLVGFRAMKVGRRAFLPTRAEIIRLGDYMSCSHEETNTMLLSLGFMPVPQLLEKDALRAAMNSHLRVLEALPYPAFILNRDWSILATNNASRTLFNVSIEYEDLLTRKGDAHMLRLIFDPDYEYHHRLRLPRGIADPAFEAFARVNIRGFKAQNAMAVGEPWYREICDGLIEADLPDFARLWSSTDADTVIDGVDTPLARSVATAPHHVYRFLPADVGSAGRPFSLIPMRIALGDADYPIILAQFPADDEARRWFAEHGI